MDFEGRSILEVKEDPQTAINTADIAILKTEVNVLDTRVDTLQSTVAGLGSLASDFGLIQILCPKSADTATSRTRVKFNVADFYEKGMSDDASSRYTIRQLVSGGLQFAGSPTRPKGFQWLVPANYSLPAAVFEVDVSVSWIPSVVMDVSFMVEAYKLLSNDPPVSSQAIGLRTYGPSTSVATFDLRTIVSVPLTNGQGQRAGVIVLFPASVTSDTSEPEVVYGVGQGWGKNHMIIRRLQ
jgi:hypothetical protein